ncbi:MAG: 50S ribosomal protein L9 [Bacteroidetes bacterium]|nr:50S ribosomal protein L9 [Bacteroidota bacterium]MBU1115808.1 50S ribosomal protein L9 [Bacteroidota bacterium]MBU1800201.1 50S ribosomal protein L9 [Bacteroidota bacterium]
MKVILRKNFNQLGQIGDLVNVKDGFARNFLFPRHIALIANPSNLRALEEEKKQASSKEAKILDLANKLSAELEKVSVTIPVTVGEDEKLFGSVTTKMISEALKEKGYDIDHRKIDIEEPIKALGIYDVKIKVHADVTASVKTWVVRD